MSCEEVATFCTLINFFSVVIVNQTRFLLREALLWFTFFPCEVIGRFPITASGTTVTVHTVYLRITVSNPNHGKYQMCHNIVEKITF